MICSTQYTKDKNPWYSFRPYQESDANNFKGRGKDITEVMKFINRNNFVVCYAKSGIGKSSLINAGLMPRLRKKQILPIQIKFTEDFFATENFEERIRNQIYSEIQKLNDTAKNDKRDERYSIEKHPSIEECELMMAIDKELADTSIWWWLSTYQIICKYGEFEIVYQPIFIFDQFEELFQKTQTDGPREKFFNWLQEMSLARPSDIIQKRIQTIQNNYPDINVYLPQDCGWKILLSLREDYVGLLDYWCIQRIRIPEIQDNRYCLMPLTIEQAEEVITQQTIDEQRVNILDKYKQAIIDSLIDTDGVPAVLLSVLCNRIYDEVSIGNTHTAQRLLHMASNDEISDETIKKTIRSLIRSVYENRIKESKISKRIVRKIEQILVRDNGTRRRLEMGEMSESLQIVCRKLADTYLVRIDDFGERKGMRVQYVEIIHDRVAEIIADKRHEIGKKNKVLWSRFALFAGIISLFVYTYWNQLSTYNEEKACFYPYMELKSRRTKNVSDYYGRKFENEWNLQTLICDKTGVIVSNCPELETIDASNCGYWDLSIKVSDCEKLMSIDLDKNIRSLSLEISGCPLIQQIELPENIDDLNLKIISDKLIFKISNKNSHFIWSNGILWDKEKDSILYARSDTPENIIVPFGTDKSKYSYAPRVYSVENLGNLKLDYYNENGEKVSINFDRNIEELDLSTYPIKEIPEGLCKNLKKLKVIKFPSSLSIRIRKEAFYGCDNLTTVEFADSSDVEIESNAFRGCISLAKIKFPENVKIAIGAFANCSSLQEIIFGGRACLAPLVFEKCISLEIVYLPSTLDTDWYLFNNPFGGCLKIKTLNYDSKYWDIADDGTVFYKRNHKILLTNMVTYHTFEDSIFYSKNGILYKKSDNSIFNEPINNVQQNALFIDDGKRYINNRENSTKLFIKYLDRNGRVVPLFALPTNLKELHLPFSNVIDLSSIDEIIPDSIKANVTLYVPHGCLKYFINHPSYKEFKNIKEEKLYNSLFFIIKHHFKTGLSVVNHYNLWIMIALIVIFTTFVLAWFMYYKKRKDVGVVTNKDKWLFVLKAFATTIIGPCFWYIFYWFFFLTILPLFTNNKEIIFLPLTWGTLSIFAGVISIISVYIILYSDGFNLNGLWNSTKNNWRIIKQISVNAYMNPKRTIKILLLLLLPFIVYFVFIQYTEYKKKELKKAINYVNREIDKATNHPKDALKIYYRAWKDTHNIIKNKDIELTLYEKTYPLLIEELSDTCLENVSGRLVMVMPDGKLLFTNLYETKLFRAQNDIVSLIKDKFDIYRVNTSGKYLAFSKDKWYSPSAMVMNLDTQEIDTIVDCRNYSFYSSKPLLAYVKDKSSIQFYDLDMKKDADMPIYVNHEIKDFCSNENGDMITILSDNEDANTILLHHRRRNKWGEPDTISKLIPKGRYSNPVFITKDVFSVYHNDSLIVWQSNNIGENERRWKMSYRDELSSFSPDGRFAIIVNGNTLKVLDLSVSEKIYVTINMPSRLELEVACFSKDGESVYLKYKNDHKIIRIPLSPQQVYQKLKEKVGND